MNYFSGRGHIALPWNLSDGQGIQQQRLKSAILVNDTEAFVIAAVSGLGIIQVPGCVVKGQLESGELVEILSRASDVSRPLSVMYPAKDHLAPQVRAFIDWVTSIVQQVKSPWIQKA